MIDFTKEPPEFRCNQYVKDKFLPRHQADSTETYPNGEVEYIFDYNKMIEDTKAAMHLLGIPYASHRDDTSRKADSFSEEENKFFAPFAFMLCCLDGNAFCTPEQPEHMHQYVADAYNVMRSNREGSSEEDFREELRGYIENAHTNAR